MSSGDERSSRALAELGCEGIRPGATVLVGGLGLGYTLRAALDRVDATSTVEVAELVAEVVQWNREHVGHLAGHPLDDPRTVVRVADVAEVIADAPGHYDAILLDVDNGPDALAHDANDGLYRPAGIRAAKRALRPGGTLGVWSFSDDPRFTKDLRAAGFEAQAHRVEASRKGRGRHHVIWIARASRMR